MGRWIFVAACLACALLWAYTLGVQKATLYWGRRLGEGNEFFPARGMQDAITPQSQTARNIATLASLIVLPVAGVYRFEWFGLGGFVAALVTSLVFNMLLPKPDSAYYFNMIMRGLANRRAHFVRASDTLRAEATDAVLKQLRTVADPDAKRLRTR